MDSNYLKLKLATKKAAETPARQAIAIDRPANVYKPKSFHPHKVAHEKQKESEGKKAREDKDKVMEMLFAAFEKHQYYNIKDLQKLTRQPIVSFSGRILRYWNLVLDVLWFRGTHWFITSYGKYKQDLSLSPNDDFFQVQPWACIFNLYMRRHQSYSGKFIYLWACCRLTWRRY